MTTAAQDIRLTGVAPSRQPARKTYSTTALRRAGSWDYVFLYAPIVILVLLLIQRVAFRNDEGRIQPALVRGVVRR